MVRLLSEACANSSSNKDRRKCLGSKVSVAHRSSKLKQTNKPNKKRSGKQVHGKFSVRSVTSIGKLKAGRTLAELISVARKSKSSKELKVDAKNQRRKQYNTRKPPRLLLFLPFHDTVDVLKTRSDVLKTLNGKDVGTDAIQGLFCWDSGIQQPAWAKGCRSGAEFVWADVYSRLKSGADKRAIMLAILDLCKVVDGIVCMFGEASHDQPAFDDLGYEMMCELTIQGLPFITGISAPTHLEADQSMSGTQSSKISKKNAALKWDLISRYFASEFGKDYKIFDLGCHSLGENRDSTTRVNFLRHVLGQFTEKTGKVLRDESRGFLLAEEISPGDSSNSVKVTGVVRGVGLCCKHPIHITGVGDFVCTKIVATKLVDLIDDNTEGVLEEWKAERSAEEMLLEPSEQDLTGCEDILNEGCSDEPSDASSDCDMDDDNDDNDDDDKEEGNPSQIDESDGDALMAEGDESNPNSVAAMKVRMRSPDEMELKDEVDTPPDQPARERFLRYRGMERFENDEWDAYEELPEHYASIYELGHYRSVSRAVSELFKRDCLREDGELSMTTGRRVTLHLETPDADVQDRLKKKYEQIKDSNGVFHIQSDPIIVSGLLTYERKLTVNHLGLKLRPEFREDELSLASKAPVTIQCGFRRFEIQPLYSHGHKHQFPEHTNKPHMSKLHYQRKADDFSHSYIASYIGPAIATRSPVMVWSSEQGGEPQLVANGSYLTADPCRMIIKRVILTGYPFKTKKRKAVVRWMFFNPDDVQYFKPIKITTRRGRKGKIIQSLGTHGLMKCLFDKALTYDDTVCMSLYKRVYPKVVAHYSN